MTAACSYTKQLVVVTIHENNVIASLVSELKPWYNEHNQVIVENATVSITDGVLYIHGTRRFFKSGRVTSDYPSKFNDFNAPFIFAEDEDEYEGSELFLDKVIETTVTRWKFPKKFKIKAVKLENDKIYRLNRTSAFDKAFSNFMFSDSRRKSEISEC